MPGQRGPESIAKADADSGRQERGNNEFRDEDQGDMYCDLCWAGPFAHPGQRVQHEQGSRHRRNHITYRVHLLICYRERDCIEEERQSALRFNESGCHFLDRRNFAALYESNSFWCGDLTELKASLYDLVIGSGPIQDCNIVANIGPLSGPIATVDATYKRHVHRIQADLLMLAYVKVHLVAEFGSIDQYRIQCVAHEQPGHSRASSLWKQRLAAASQPGCQLLELVMPWVANVVTPLEVQRSRIFRSYISGPGRARLEGEPMPSRWH